MSIIKNIIINSNNSYISALNSEKKIFIVKHLLDMDYRFYKMTLVGDAHSPLSFRWSTTSARECYVSPRRKLTSRHTTL